MPSTAIRAIDYDAPAHELTVGFVSGSVYVYEDVPERVYRDFRAAPSKGRFFASEIRPRFLRYRKLRDREPRR
ncbi:MAG TPA: KTSC domain-containing protein [Caulobacteraceae bacterium]|jgi:hypothetical protein|nr:KTSC domain-containing protein [Caulobacteraceae bacterium]